MAKSKGIMERVSCLQCSGTGVSIGMIKGSRIESKCPICKGKGYTMKKKKGAKR